MVFVIKNKTGYFAKSGDGPTCWIPSAKRANTFDTKESADHCLSKIQPSLINKGEVIEAI